jgi:hypothetical protein
MFTRTLPSAIASGICHISSREKRRQSNARIVR